MKRRDILKGLAILPLAGAIPGTSQKGLATPVAKNGTGLAGDPFEAGAARVYQSIGVEPVINCRGTFTIIGASVELPVVREAM